ncbi:MAG: hypothetical protein JJT89_17350 [Nitriliruptoraceae bacterium]|nr:hypothetical protein [Nitriliruptoraceae bacterium]
MTETSFPDTTTDRAVDLGAGLDEQAQRTIDWLEVEFPGWSVELDDTATWDGNLRPLWIARRDGHHPQAELTAAKLHTRLTEYHEREDKRRALAN